MVPEFRCYKRIPDGISTTNPREDGFVSSDRFVDDLDRQFGEGGGLGTRHKMDDGSVELRSLSPSVLNAASVVLRNEGFIPQRKRHS